MRTGISIDVTAEDRRRLEAVVADRNTPQKHVWRARIVLLTAAGAGRPRSCAKRECPKQRSGVGRSASWSRVWTALLRDKTRPPGRAPVASERVAEVVRLTQTEPPHEATHWTARAMAKACGLAVSTVQEIWKAHAAQEARRHDQGQMGLRAGAPAAQGGARTRPLRR